jgi:hypothetical protein
MVRRGRNRHDRQRGVSGGPRLPIPLQTRHRGRGGVGRTAAFISSRFPDAGPSTGPSCSHSIGLPQSSGFTSVLCKLLPGPVGSRCSSVRSRCLVGPCDSRRSKSEPAPVLRVEHEAPRDPVVYVASDDDPGRRNASQLDQAGDCDRREFSIPPQEAASVLRN